MSWFCYNYTGGIMNSIYSYTRSELADYFKGIGEKAFKSDQLFDWL